jgi:hypothetical protein
VLSGSAEEEGDGLSEGDWVPLPVAGVLLLGDGVPVGEAVGEPLELGLPEGEELGDPVGVGEQPGVEAGWPPSAPPGPTTALLPPDGYEDSDPTERL